MSAGEKHLVWCDFFAGTFLERIPLAFVIIVIIDFAEKNKTFVGLNNLLNVNYLEWTYSFKKSWIPVETHYL